MVEDKPIVFANMPFDWKDMSRSVLSFILFDHSDKFFSSNNMQHVSAKLLFSSVWKVQPLWQYWYGMYILFLMSIIFLMSLYNLNFLSWIFFISQLLFKYQFFFLILVINSSYYTKKYDGGSVGSDKSPSPGSQAGTGWDTCQALLTLLAAPALTVFWILL